MLVKRDLRNMFCKEILVNKVVEQIEKEDGIDFTYSLNNHQAVIVTNNYKGEDEFGYEILVERNLYEELQKLNIVPKISWN